VNSAVKETLSGLVIEQGDGGTLSCGKHHRHASTLVRRLNSANAPYSSAAFNTAILTHPVLDEQRMVTHCIGRPKSQSH
jgi:hypothetical protein